MSQTQTRLKLILLVLMTLTGGLQWLGSTSELTETSQSSLSSADPKSERSTKLGIAIPTKDKPAEDAKREMEILLKDPAMQQVWGHLMTSSQKAWQISKGSKEIIVAIIDTGIDVQHPDLKANLWVNKGEVANNGLDDDNNGYVDDVHGWNFVANNHDLSDNHGHGSHIAGIVGANGPGLKGVSPQVSLMTLKYYDPKAAGINNLSNTVKAIDYAVKMGANIINYSGGGLEPSEPEKQAIARAQEKGILFVAAAGNEKSNSDLKAYYPADYDLPNIISVTAIDKTRNVLPSSNWGVNTVDIAAPGNDIRSTLPDGQYGYMTGTSQATAFVTGVAVLVMAQNRELRSADRIIKYLTQTGDVEESLDGKTRTRRRLNSYRALAIKDADLSFAGTSARNAVNISPKSFVSDPNVRDSALADTPETKLTLGGRDIMNFIEATSGPKTRIQPSARDAGDSNL